VETHTTSGSGILLDDGYVLTNAHVVWPYETARIYFPDGTDLEDVPVADWNLMVDLAVLGPIDTDLPPLTLANGEDLIVGSNVYLIGYPGEVEDLPEPTITRGLISRFREWEPFKLTYFQTDASIGGGQSGGALVSEMGEVIGISGNTFSDAGFGLAASATDIANPYVSGLIAGEDMSRLGDRFLDMDALKRTTTTSRLNNRWDQQAYIIDAEEGEDIEIEFSGQNVNLWLMSPMGDTLLLLDGSSSGKEVVETAVSAPHFITLNTPDVGTASITSNYELIRISDPDENEVIKLNEPLFAAIDFPGDLDSFMISLDKGDVINITVDSVAIDPVVVVSFLGADQDQELYDDDSGEGLFGVNAEMSYEVPQNGLYYISVFDAGLASNHGGYILTVREMAAGDPTPVAPEPTPTPIASEFGEMALYESVQYPFTMQYSADFEEDLVDYYGFDNICSLATACVANPNAVLLLIAEEDISQLPFEVNTQDEYVDLYMTTLEENLTDAGLEHTTLETEQGKTVDIFTYSIGDETTVYFSAWRLIYLHDGHIGFNATYIIDPDAPFDQALIDEIFYSFSTFRVE
jgi:hypothetical protein